MKVSSWSICGWHSRVFTWYSLTHLVIHSLDSHLSRAKYVPASVAGFRAQIMASIHFPPIMTYNLRNQEIQALIPTSLCPPSLRPPRMLAGRCQQADNSPPETSLVQHSMFLCGCAKSVWVNHGCEGVGGESGCHTIHREAKNRNLKSRRHFTPDKTNCTWQRSQTLMLRVTHFITSSEGCFVEKRILRFNSKGMKWLDDLYHLI